MAFGSKKVRTGAYAYIEYDFETSHDTGGNPTCCGKVFGLEQKIGSWTWTNNRIPLHQLNSVEPVAFAYGQARGSISVDFILSNPWYNSLLFDRSCCFPAVACMVETFTWEATCNAGTKDVESFTMEVGVCLPCANIDRTLSGAVLNSLTLRSSIGDPIRASADIAYSTDTIGACIDASPASETVGTGCSQYTPFTFAHGQLQWNCCVVTEVQSFDITLNQNADLLYGHNSNKPVSSFRRVFEMTGTFQASWTCNLLLNDLYAQIADNCQTLAEEQTQFVLTFDNGLTTTNQRKITYTFTGISIGDHGTSIEPVEPIFENITWQARRGQVVAVTNDTAEP